MKTEWYKQLADDVSNGHLSDEQAERLEREYELGEYLAACEADARQAMDDE